eukprot:TRINITY_DN27279_c0_g1_i1.p1 TRINITY_DN27279_c0_g1~~TRINITY_DN27279_c0_g1_i1.p1  ORF type:complete len:473 (-),score=50.39 TRINITY_DN27279_c0_g1_i1:127-1362(-)
MAETLAWLVAQGQKASLRVWAVEIYFDNVFDLLNNKAPVNIASNKGFTYQQNSAARYDENGKWIPPFLNGKWNAQLSYSVDSVVGKREEVVTTLADIARIGQVVEVSRSCQGHAFNDRSSRSHAVLGAVLSNGGRTSHFLFVDLAGSERVKKSNVSGLRMAEAVCTNTSLAALQRVISARASNARHVPYRDSALTKMLRQSLAGAACGGVVVTLSPGAAHADESQSSLRFAKQYLKVSSCVQRNEIPDHGSISQALQRAERELANLANSQHAGRVDPQAGEQLKQSWRHNVSQLEMFQKRLLEAKQQMNSGQKDPSLQATISHANAKITLHQGIVARMMLSGLYKNPSKLVIAKQQEVLRLRQALADVMPATDKSNSVNQEDLAVTGGELILGSGLKGMINHIVAQAASPS